MARLIQNLVCSFLFYFLLTREVFKKNSVLNGDGEHISITEKWSCLFLILLLNLGKFSQSVVQHLAKRKLKSLYLDNWVAHSQDDWLPSMIENLSSFFNKKYYKTVEGNNLTYLV